MVMTEGTISSSVNENISLDDDLFNNVTKLWIPGILDRVRIKATELARTDGRNDVTAQDISRALETYMPGVPVPNVARTKNWFEENINGFMFVTAVLTIAFGMLGVLGLYGVARTEGFLEVAKIFAGALVGGAAGAASAQMRR